MRISNGEESVLPDIIPSLTITVDESIAQRLTKVLYDYQYKYRDKPTHFLLSPEEYLSFVADLKCSMHNFAGLSLEEPVTFHDILVIPVVDGLAINLKNLSHITWDRQSKQKEPVE